MNKKVIGTHADSNVTRAAAKEEQADKLKEVLKVANLREVPKSFMLYDENIYNILIDNLEKLNINHLQDIDTYSLVKIANSMYLLNDIEKSIKKHGIEMKLITRDEGAEKIIPSQFLASRNALINTLDKQLTSLQISPRERNDLLVATSTDISNIQLSDDDLTSLLEMNDIA